MSTQALLPQLRQVTSFAVGFDGGYLLVFHFGGCRSLSLKAQTLSH